MPTQTADGPRAATAQIKFSIVVPARNEEAFIGNCLESIRIASAPYPNEVEVIVVLNRCTDATEAIARSYGAVVTEVEGKNLSCIRNAGAALARGEILITIDADSVMSGNMLTTVERALRSGEFVGGGVMVWPERYSPGVLLTFILIGLIVLRQGLAGGLYWCMRKDFDAVGGFDPDYVSAEDLDFARRLKAFGQSRNLRFTMLFGAFIRTSCRKWDRFGDWYLLRNPTLVRSLLAGKDQSAANGFYYDVER